MCSSLFPCPGSRERERAGPRFEFLESCDLLVQPVEIRARNLPQQVVETVHDEIAALEASDL